MLSNEKAIEWAKQWIESLLDEGGQQYHVNILRALIKNNEPLGMTDEKMVKIGATALFAGNENDPDSSFGNCEDLARIIIKALRAAGYLASTQYKGELYAANSHGFEKRY